MQFLRRWHRFFSVRVCWIHGSLGLIKQGLQLLRRFLQPRRTPLLTLDWLPSVLRIRQREGEAKDDEEHGSLAWQDHQGSIAAIITHQSSAPWSRSEDIQLSRDKKFSLAFQSRLEEHLSQELSPSVCAWPVSSVYRQGVPGSAAWSWGNELSVRRVELYKWDFRYFWVYSSWEQKIAWFG